MKTTATVRLNPDWAQRACIAAGGVADFASALNADKSTIYRHLAGNTEAGPRLIAAVLTNYAVTFQDAFDIVDVADSNRRTYEPRGDTA